MRFSTLFVVALFACASSASPEPSADPDGEAPATEAAPQGGPQFDAPFLAKQQRMQAEWAEEDRGLDARLAALRERFGKRPNIIYILTDDIGWGELGWQGGGKHRGTPTPNLDRMAREGMRFWSAYAEPSCTPTRIAINTGRHPVRTGLLSVLWPGQLEGLSLSVAAISPSVNQ